MARIREIYKSADEANPSLKGVKPPLTLAQMNSIAVAADAIANGDNPPEAGKEWPIAIASFKKSNEVKNGAWVKKGGGAEAAPDTAGATVTDPAAEPDPTPTDAPAKDTKPAADKAEPGKATVKPTVDSLRVEVVPIVKFDPVTLEHVDVDPSQGISAVIGLPVKWKDGDPKQVQTYVFTGDAWADASAAKWIKKKGAKKGQDWQSGGPDQPGANDTGSAADTAPADTAGDGTDTTPMAQAELGDDRESRRRAGGKREHTLAEIRMLVKKTDQLLQEVRGVKPITSNFKVREHGMGDEGGGMEHDDGNDFEMPAPLAGVTSYADLENRQAADTSQEELKKIVYFFPQLASEILRRVADEKGKPLDAKGKLKMLKSLADEFVTLAGEALTNAPDVTPPEASGAPAEADKPQPDGERLAESFVVTLAEADHLAEAGATGRPLRMLVELIQPGWGNTTDNHYYPADMLRQCAEKFVGRKMFESDHRPEEKSTRTWVSTIEKIRGFSDRGAPLAEVLVHDPGFAERVRNLRSAGMLDKMECSILADGTATAFEEGGRTGKRVTEITAVESVDWVTRAGAGGHAAELAESGQRGDEAMGDKLTAAAKQTLVEASRLPQAARVRLAERDYKDESELKAAIDKERAYLAEVTGAGKVFGNAPGNGEAVAVSEADTNKAKDAVLAKWFGKGR